jgi:hypothetical protein
VEQFVDLVADATADEGLSERTRCCWPCGPGGCEVSGHVHTNEELVAAARASGLDDVGHLGFQYGPADQPPMASGMNIARTKEGPIELYAIVTEMDQPS